MPKCTMCGLECYATAEGTAPKSHCCNAPVTWLETETSALKYANDVFVLPDSRDEGRKDDSEKIRMELLPFESLEAVAKVLTFGAKKYADNNWQKVSDAKIRYLGAMLRHLSAHLRGERIDGESGLSHLSHVATNALFLVWFETQKEKDNG